ncbi:hypothetical protein Q31a_63120 [Aureliella helgolandensis]|uniref:Uncharacterized protein n=1 Tax=Aureliella helgolandensis TaxID=2527968 RepID=A0A518GH54_9BACT|nr:hypothetical protein Q31a_63120 [Aureliella helgolandensis]
MSMDREAVWFLGGHEDWVGTDNMRRQRCQEHYLEK